MTTRYRDRPIYWLVLLEQARERGDRRGAAEAARQLARLGVRVSYGRPTPRRQQAGEAAHA